MAIIEYVANLDESLGEMIGVEFEKFAAANGVVCNYAPFSFVAKESGEVIGIITGHSYYGEAHILDLIVCAPHRGKHIGSQLMEAAENHHRGKGFTHIALSTYRFQAPGFYEKCGYRVEFIREHKRDPHLDKFFLVKPL